METYPAVANPVALTIAGFDPSSGAGITADLAVFAAHNVFGIAAITALTVQSTTGVQRVESVHAELLTETLACLETDLPPAGIKIGMLAGPAQVAAVAAYLRSLRTRERGPFVVLDPVLRSSSGKDLLSTEGLDCLQADLLPLVGIVTPNTEELSVLTGLPCGTQEEIEAATVALCDRYPGLSVLVTGGHRTRPDDVLLNGGRFSVLPGERIETRATHGTGCALSSALLCGLLRGNPYAQAACDAKAYVATAMRQAVPRGAGRGPMHLLWPLSRQK